jgi:hypothetical protein
VENLSLLLTEEIRNLSLCDVHFLALLILIWCVVVIMFWQVEKS